MGREVDHDRFDWVITYIFKRRLDQGEAQGFGGIGQQIAEMFPDFPQPPLSDAAKQQLSVLSERLQQINAFTNFAQLQQSGLIAKGRELKESFDEERYHPAVLAAVVNYNLVLGKAFKSLFDEAAGRSRELAAKLSGGDYRSNIEPLRKLAETTSRIAAPSDEEDLDLEPAAYTPAKTVEVPLPPPPVAAPVVRGPLLDPAKELGLDENREAQKLRFTLRSLVAFFEVPENRLEIAARVGTVTLTFADWEARSLQTDYPDEDKSFRADFARAMKHTAALMMRMTEEIDLLSKKASSEYLWKPHYDSLVWLFAKGRDHVQVLNDFAAATGKRGLLEKQQQIAKTATRLVGSLEKVAKSF
jgi:hypothetical protein